MNLCLFDAWITCLCWIGIFGMNFWALHVKTNWESDVFAQATSSRLSKNTRNSTLFLRKLSPRRAGFA